MEFLDPQKKLTDRQEIISPVAKEAPVVRESKLADNSPAPVDEEFEQKKNQSQESDTDRANEIREELGLPPQEAKRFKLSKENFARERVGAIKEIVAELKNEHPEVLSFCLYGSMVKGTARPDSDIDGYLFVDASESGERRNMVDTEPKIDRQDDAIVSTKPQAQFAQGPENLYTSALRGKFQEKFGFDDEKMKDLKVLPISEEIIDAHVAALQKYFEELSAYEKAWETRDWEAGGESPQRPRDVFVSENLSKMFHLEVGGGIRQYREYLVEKLATLGEIGDKIWRDIISATATMEHGGIDNARYPKTVEEAREIYGGK